jgi:Capsule assembly protein Wzi
MTCDRLRHHLIVCAVVLTGILSGPCVDAADRTDIPLKNWGGFAIVRDAAYDDLERLATAGLFDRAILNTKPMSRAEAARLVARAIEKIRADTEGVYNNRQDLESVLNRLIEEFRPELASLGAKVADGSKTPAPGFFSFTPIDRAQVRGGYVNRDFSLINNQGLKFQRGVNGGLTFESRAQVGDFVTFYLQPELHGNEEYGAARLTAGYVKLTAFNVELLAGRENLWWGPGLHGSLIMSNNAPPLDHVRIGSAEAFTLPLIGDWIGPTKILAFFAQLEQRRDIPRADMAGLRGTIAPFSFLEIGASYVNIFGGDQSPRLRGVGDYFRVLLDPQASDQGLTASQRFRNNALFALDADLRIANVHRFFVPAQDGRVYGEFGWDDTCCSTSFVPLRAATSYLFGVHLLGLFGDEGLDWRFEYATSSVLSFTHNQFFRGYWTRGEVISHFIGTDGSDIRTRVTKRVGPDLMFGVTVNRSVIGDTALNGAARPHERRIGGGLDVSYRFAQVYTIFAQAQVMYSNNRDFVAGDNGFDGLVLVELTRSFR